MKNKWHLRTWVQIGFFTLIALLAFNNNWVEKGAESLFGLAELSLHAICPFGGVTTLYNLATIGDYIQKIHASSVVILGISVFLAILFGPVLCGWVCPLGSIQEWVGKLGRRLFGKRYNHWIPTHIDRPLRYVRYLVLAWVVYITAKSGTLVFVNVDPYYALMNFYTGEVAWTAFLILGITLAGALFVERPWCKYACPYGALMGLSNKFKVFTIRRTEATCISCTKCDRVCPMNLNISKSDAIRNTQCISCLECTSERTCPVANTVEFKVR